MRKISRWNNHRVSTNGTNSWYDMCKILFVTLVCHWSPYDFVSSFQWTEVGRKKKEEENKGEKKKEKNNNKEREGEELDGWDKNKVNVTYNTDTPIESHVWNTCVLMKVDASVVRSFIAFLVFFFL